jgi:hypothetical protein
MTGWRNRDCAHNPVSESHLWRCFNRCGQIFGQVLQGSLGLILKQPTIFQKHTGLTACCHDSFPEPEYKQLCLSVVSVRRRFHFVQVVYGDHLS